MRNHIDLLINGVPHQIRGNAVFSTLSNYLRHDLGAIGTKVVCEEGDCGACTVLMRRSADDELRPVNSCIQTVAQLDGASIVTVEGLKHDGALHPVQESMVVCHGAQCGFCTPGFVVAMCAMFETCDKVDERQVRDGLTGNLCRCTGYEPIIKAALEVDGSAAPKLRERYADLPQIRDGALIEADIDGAKRTFFAPTTIADAVNFKASRTGCTIVQGGTDVGVWINKRHFRAPAMLSLAHVAGLDELREEQGEIVVGANVTLARFEAFVRERIPELARILAIFGAPQIKNAGTLAGNIANGSPIADTLPYLFVADARLELTGTSGPRIVPVGSFYRGYRLFDLAADELITRVFVPIIDDVRLYKVSRRKDLDISAFTAAIALSVDGEVITNPRIAYGGVGPIVLRLPQTEAFLAGKAPTLELFEAAGAIAKREITPISDVRGSADYRLQLAENILARYWFDAFGDEVAITPPQERRGPDRPFA